MSTDLQRANSLRIANEKRQSLKTLKIKLDGGHLSLEDVLLPSPMKTVEGQLAVDVVRWTPRFGDSRMRRLGDSAVRAGVNLLLPVSAMSRVNRQWLADEVLSAGVGMSDVEVGRAVREGRELEADALRLQVDQSRRLLAKAERDRDAALRRVEELDRGARARQFVMPTVEAERMIAELADAVEEHKRTVTGPSAPEKWALADETLWAAKDQILQPCVVGVAA